eukprot:76527_1
MANTDDLCLHFDQEKNQKVLILGATGYIGATLAKLLNETPDIDCYALVRPTSNYIAAIQPFCRKVIVCKSKEISTDDISTALSQYKITCVVSLISPPESHNDNIEKSCQEMEHFYNNLLNTCIQYDPKILVITTSGNFSLFTDDMKNVIISPSASNTPIPKHKYKNSIAPKHQIVLVHTENVIRKFIDKGYNVIITYPCSVYGPSPINRNGIWDVIITDLINNPNSDFNSMKKIFTSWIDVRDCATAYLQIIKYGTRNNYYLIGNESCHVMDLLMLLARNVNLKYPEQQKRNFMKSYKQQINNNKGIIWDTQTTLKKLNFKPVYSLYDKKTLQEWINVLNYHYFTNVVKSKL